MFMKVRHSYENRSYFLQYVCILPSLGLCVWGILKRKSHPKVQLH